jgi:hypothetical protein
LKKIIFCALWFSFTTSFAQIKPEVYIGYNLTNQSNIGNPPFKDYNHSSTGYGTYSSINSFLVGAGVEVPLGKKWFLEPAILYFGNGTHISEQTLNPGIDWYLNVNIRLYYLRIPVNFVYETDLVKSVHVFAGAGLYFARGIWGKENGQLITEGGFISTQTLDKNVKFSSGTSSSLTEPSFNPYDLGYTILAGIEWKKFKLTSSISNGLIKACSGYNYNLWNSAFSVYLTYQFPKIR